MIGHADCVRFVKSFDVPMIVLGGGGYTIRNVAKAWAYETGILVGEDLHASGPHMPFNKYFEYFGPEFRLDVPNNNMDNQNSTEYLDHIRLVVTLLCLCGVADQRNRSTVLEGLRHLPFAPSIGMQAVPPDLPREEVDSEDELDVRITRKQNQLIVAAELTSHVQNGNVMRI